MKIDNSLIKVAFVDKNKTFISVIAPFIESSNKVKVVAELTKGEQILNFLKKNEVDIVVTEFKLKDITADILTEKIKKNYPKVKVVVFTEVYEMQYSMHFFDAGGDGYIYKKKGVDDLADTLVDIYHQKKIENKFRLRTLASNMQKILTHRYNISKLSEREQNIIHLLLTKGIPKKNIAAKLKISNKTLYTHFERIKTKLNIRSITEILSVALIAKVFKLEDSCITSN